MANGEVEDLLGRLGMWPNRFLYESRMFHGCQLDQALSVSWLVFVLVSVVAVRVP